MLTAAKLMRDSDQHALVVTDETNGRLVAVGLVCEAELFRSMVSEIVGYAKSAPDGEVAGEGHTTLCGRAQASVRAQKESGCADRG